MYIIYDARHFEDYYSGLSRYSFSVLKAMIEDGKYEVLDIVLNSNYDYTSNPLFMQIEQICGDRENFIYIDAPIFSLKQSITVSRYVNNSKCDLYFYPHFDMPVFIKKKSVFVIHDLFPLVLESYILQFSYLKKIYFKSIIYLNISKKNTKCVAVSNTTKKDILNFFGEKFENKISVIYEDSYSDAGDIKSINKSDLLKDIDKRYLFYVGKRRKHKNLKQMIDIFNILIDEKLYDGYFLIAGNETNYYFNVEEYIKDKKNIILLGEIPDGDLEAMYSNMEALFFLSKYEGFGLPLVETAKYNKKIITSNMGACGEIAPSNSLKVDLDKDNKELAQEIAFYLNDKEKIDYTSYLKKFSWKLTADYLTSQHKQ